MAPEEEAPEEVQQEAPIPAPSTQDYAEVLRRRQKQLETVGDAAWAINPDQAAKVIRVARQYKVPEQFASENIDALEAAEKKGELANENLVETHPIIAQAIKSSPFAGSVILKNLPNLKKLEFLYSRPVELWPLSKEDKKAQALRLSDLEGEKTWETRGKFNAPSKDEWKRQLYQNELGAINREEAIISGQGPLGFGESLKLKAEENPAFWLPFGGHLIGAIGKSEAHALTERIQKGEGDEADIIRFERMRRLQGAITYRTKGFAGYVAEAAAGFPAMAGEMHAGGLIGKAAAGGMGLLGRTIAEKLLGAGVESLTASATAGLGQTAEAMAGGQNLASAAGGTFIDYLSGHIFGSWFTQGTPEVQTALKQSLAWAFPKEALKMLGMQEAGGAAKYLTGIQEEKPASFRALGGDLGALKELGAQGLVGGFSGVVHAGYAKAREAKMFAEGVVRRAELLHENLSKESPQLAAELSTAMAEGGPHESLYVPVKEWKAYWESKGVDPGQKLAEIYGDPKRYEEALKAGTDIRIPTPGWDHVIGRDPEAVKALSESVRDNSPNVMNLKEAAAMGQLSPENMPEVVHEHPLTFKEIMEGRSEAPPERQAEALKRAAMPLESLTDPTLLGLNEKQLAKYREVEAQAKEEASNTLLEQETLRQRARASKEFKADAAAIRSQVEAEVNARPEQLALAWLKNGKTPAGEPVSEPFKLSREDLKTQFGEGILNRLPKGVHAEEGLHLDVAAEVFGFKSGQDLVKALSDLHRAPQSLKEHLLRQRAEALEARHEKLLTEKGAAEAEGKAQTKEVLAGKEALAERLSKALKEHERQSRADVEGFLRDVKDRGGPSDEVAQDFADLGRIKDAYVETLKDKIKEWRETVKESKAREKDFPAEARKIARERLPEMLDALVRNKEEQVKLGGQLEEAAQASRSIPRVDPREAAIDAETERRIDEKYPNGWTPEELSNEAVAALHGEKAQELEHLTLQHIVENHLTALKGMERVASRSLLPLKEIREQAKMDPLKYRVSEIPDQISALLNAEHAAEREAKANVLKGKWEQVFDAKLQALEAHTQYLVAAEAKREIEKTFALGKRLAESETWNKKDAYDFGQQGKDILRRIGLIAVDPENLQNKPPLEEWLKSEKVAEAFGYEPLTVDSNFLNENFTIDHRDMAYGDVLMLRRTLDQLKIGATRVNTVADEGRRTAIEDITREVDETLAKTVGIAPPEARSKSGKSKYEAIAGFGKRIHGSLVEQERIFRQLDGGKIDGPLTRFLWNRYNEAQVKKDTFIKRWVSAIEEANAAMPKEIRARLGEKISIPGTDESFTRADAIILAANGSNESNYVKTREGEKIRAKKNRGWGLTEDQMHYVVGQLTEPEKDHAQSLVNAFEGFWPEVEALNIKLKGHPPEKIQAKQMFLEMGTRPGGYFPVMYAPGYSHAGDLQVSDNPSERLFEPAYKFATTDGGNRIKRTDYVGPISFDIGRLNSEVKSLCQDLAFREYAADCAKLLRDEGFKDVLRNRLGNDGEVFIREWLKRSINHANEPSGEAAQTFNSIIGKVRHSQTIATLAARASTVAHHAFGIDTCIREVGFSAFAKGLREFFSRPRQWLEQMRSEAPDIAHILDTAGDPNIYESLQNLEGKRTWFAEFQRFLMKGITIGNILRTGPTYVGARLKAAEALKAEGRAPDEAERLAIRQAAQSVRLSIGSGRPGDLPGIYDSEMAKVFLMYFAPQRVRYGQYADAVADFKKTGSYSKLAANFLFFPMLGMVVHALGSGKFGPDEDKDETWPGWIGKGTFDYGLSSVPMGSMAAKTIEAFFTGKHETATQAIPVVDAMTKAMEAARLIGRWWEDEEEFGKAFDATQRAAGQFMGYPSEQLSITGGYLMDLMNGTTDNPDDILQFLHHILWRRPKER